MIQRTLKICAPLATALALFGGQAAAGTIDSDSITSGGVTRTFTWYEPDSLGGTARPLLIALHGSGGTGSGMMDNVTEYRFNERADEDKWIVVYPDGIEVSGKGRWNDCRISDNNPTTDDVLFVSDLIDHFEGLYNIDTDRIYVAGHSNGSMMAHRIGIELSDRVAAIAGTTGSLAAEGAEYNECSEPVNPISVIYEAATEDPVIPYEGGSEGGGVLRSQEDTVDFWVDFNGTGTTPTVTAITDSVTTDETVITKYVHSGGTEGTEVVYYKAEKDDPGASLGPGHAWPGPTQFGVLKRLQNGFKPQDIVFADEAWDFFSSHTLGSVSGGGGGGPLLEDDFEDGDLAGWSTSGTVSNTTSQHYEGSRSAQLQQTSSMTAAISLSGETSVDLSFAYKTQNLDSGEAVKAEYALDGGGWTTLGQAKPTSWQTASFAINTTGASTLSVRFSLNANNTNEHAWIDAVLAE